MKYYCLNMETAAERRAHCEREFANAGIDVVFVKAFDTRLNGIRHQNEHYQVGHLGCMLSHLHLLEEIGRYDISPAVIFEDDVHLADGFRQKLSDAIAALPEDWQVAFAGWWPAHDNYGQLQVLDINEQWMTITAGSIWGTHCYIINGRKGSDSAMKVLQPITGHIDDVLVANIGSGTIAGYFLREPIADQTASFVSQTWD